MNHQTTFGDLVNVEELEDRNVPGILGVHVQVVGQIGATTTTIVWEEL